MTERQLQQKLLNIFRYEDGKLIWVKPPRNHMGLLGKSAGTLRLPKGYTYIAIDRKYYPRSRLIYLYHKGKFPRPICDHINRNRADDRIENLREVNIIENARNHSRISVRTMANGRFQARLAQKVIGTFDTFEQAKEAYINKRRESWSL